MGKSKRKKKYEVKKDEKNNKNEIDACVGELKFHSLRTQLENALRISLHLLESNVTIGFSKDQE